MFLEKIKTLLKTGLKFPGRQSDTAGIKINGLVVTMNRQNVINIPHEFTVVVPRVEIDKQIKLGTQG